MERQHRFIKSNLQGPMMSFCSLQSDNFKSARYFGSGDLVSNKVVAQFLDSM